MDNRKPQITVAQIKAARHLLCWRQDKLAEASGISIRSIQRIEAEAAPPTKKSLSLIVQALEHRGIEFINGPSRTGVVLVTLQKMKFKVGDHVSSDSGLTYVVLAIRELDHIGTSCYMVRRMRSGQVYGPTRYIPEHNLSRDESALWGCTVRESLET
jgi:transcriptional regulator with XRE-family HTH domain